MGQMTIGRILYNGPSLLRVLYALNHSDNQSMVPPLPGIEDFETIPTGEMKADPGSGQFFINLASELFKRPIGLGFIMDSQLNEIKT